MERDQSELEVGAYVELGVDFSSRNGCLEHCSIRVFSKIFTDDFISCLDFEDFFHVFLDPHIYCSETGDTVLGGFLPSHSRTKPVLQLRPYIREMCPLLGGLGEW